MDSSAAGATTIRSGEGRTRRRRSAMTPAPRTRAFAATGEAFTTFAIRGTA
ncbi:hypothetical protein ACFY3N_19345 [Streptomyces sp. NPDC000348]|uniref:hypothetical protein n=1 Tax=Streptomyces sp. NPDC000348 TaxID=3364538 RepID=UPI0036AFAC6E